MVWASEEHRPPGQAESTSATLPSLTVTLGPSPSDLKVLYGFARKPKYSSHMSGEPQYKPFP